MAADTLEPLRAIVAFDVMVIKYVKSFILEKDGKIQQLVIVALNMQRILFGEYVGVHVLCLVFVSRAVHLGQFGVFLALVSVVFFLALVYELDRGLES